MRVVIADDHRLMLDGIRRALEADGGFEIVGETQDGRRVLGLVSATRPDLVLLDLRMPGMDGLACLDQIRREFPALDVVILSASTSRTVVDSALARGARAYIDKSIDPSALPAELRRVNAGETLDGSARPARDGAAHDDLTARELAILAAVARGLSNDEIARELWISPPTVKFHLTNVYRKLGAKNRTGATRIAYQRGLVENPLLDE